MNFLESRLFQKELRSDHEPKSPGARTALSASSEPPALDRADKAVRAPTGRFMGRLRVNRLCAVICAFFTFATMAGLAAESAPASYQRLKAGEFMRTWLVLAPLPVFADKAEPDDQETQKKAFATDHLIDHGGEAGIRPEPGLTHKIAKQEFHWRLVESKEDIVDLVKTYGPKEYVVAYAWAEITMPEKKTALLGIGSDDAVKVWLNGKLIHENWVGRATRADDDVVPVSLQPGKNQLLLKVQNWPLGWSFACHLLGSQPLTEKLVSSAAKGDLEGLKLLVSTDADVNARNKTGLTALQAAKIGGHEDVAKFLLSKGADDKVEMPSTEQYIDSLLKGLLKGNSSGAAVLVARDGKVLLKNGYGYANLEHKVPVTPETKFRIGSVTKQFTAAAILQLQEQGKLNLKDTLSKFIPDFPRGSEVTLHHLVTHTSGIRSYTDKPDFFSTATAYIKPEDLIKSFKDDPYDFSPGEKWHYNNSGFFLLGHIIEKVSGESYGDYLKKHFFEPLAMTNTGVHHYSDILEHEATGYSYETGEVKKAMNWDMSRAGGAGALYSTVEDLFRWNEAVFNGKVLSDATLKAAFTPVKVKGDEESSLKEEGYGYGWAIGRFRGVKSINHGGGLHGFLSYLVRYPEQRFTVVLLSNAAAPPPPLDPTGVSEGIAQMYLWKELKPREAVLVDTKVDPKTYDACVGRYDYGGPILTVTRDGNRLFAQLTGQSKMEIFPKSETEFFWKVVEARVTFVKNDKGQVEKALHRQGGQTITAPKLEDAKVAKVDPTVYGAYVGKYDYGQGRAILTVTKDGDHLFAQLTGQPKFEIFPKSNTEFFWKVVNAQLTFVKDEAGKVIKGILLQSGQTIEAPKIE